MAPTPIDSSDPAPLGRRHMRRAVGFYGLLCVSVGTIIGSGWLLGAEKAATRAGPASLVSWVLASGMLAVLALVHAELGGAYPVAGGTARFPGFAFGKLVGFTAGWAAWLQAVAIAPIEVIASLQYLDNIGWVRSNLDLVNSDQTLSGTGLALATVLMLVFTTINLVGVKFLSDTNGLTVLWKTAVPALTAIALIAVTFHPGNFTAGGGFAPYGAHGIFAAMPAGVVFALQGFEQAIQLGGESKEPQRDISRAVIAAMLIGTALYILLEVSFIGGIHPQDVAHGWSKPIASGSFGPYATLATGAGLGWLAYLLYADAFISPAGAGLLYQGAASRLSYAMAHTGEIPRPLAKLSFRGVPYYSILLAFVIGELAFLPFPSWQSLVSLVTDATALMYAFAPLALTALRHADPQRVRPYRTPLGPVLAPIGFVSANLIVYWGGFDTTWKITAAIALGFLLFVVTRVASHDRSPLDWRCAAWVWPWLAGLNVIGWLGRYDSGAAALGGGELKVLPEWIDLLVVAVFSVVIYHVAVRLALPAGRVAEMLVDLPVPADTHDGPPASTGALIDTGTRPEVAPDVK